MELFAKWKRKLTVKRLDRAFGRLTVNCLKLRTAAQHMHRSMDFALEWGDETFDRGNLNQSLHIQLEKLDECKAEADRLRTLVTEHDKKGHFHRFDKRIYTMWLDMLETVRDTAVKEDIRPQERVRKQEFGGESKILDMKSGAVLKG